MHSRIGRVLAAATLALVAATGAACGGPNEAASAATIGNTALPLDGVQSQIGTIIARIPEQQRAQFPPDEVARQYLSVQIQHALISREGAQAGITVPDQAVDDAIAAQGGMQVVQQSTPLSPTEIREQFRDALIAEQLGRRAAPSLAVTADIVGATGRADAEAKARTLATGGPAADALFADSRQARRGVTYSAAARPDIAAGPLFGTAQGDTVIFQPDPRSSTWEVARITSRRTDAPAAAVGALGASDFTNIGVRLGQLTADRLGVQVNPRFGVWDPGSLMVVPAGQVTAEIFPPNPTAAS